MSLTRTQYLSFLGGDFGFKSRIPSNPVQGGLAGLAKTARQEWEHVLCKSIDLPWDMETCLESAKDVVPLFMTRTKG